MILAQGLRSAEIFPVVALRDDDGSYCGFDATAVAN